MDILVEPGRLPERGTLIVPIGHDGRLGAAAANLDQASAGLIRRAIGAGELKHGRVIDLLLPAGLQLDRLLLIALGRADGVTRLDIEEAGGGLAHKLRALKVREAHLASAEGLDLSFPPAAVVRWLAMGVQLRSYRFPKYRTGESEDDERPPERLLLGLSDGEAALTEQRAIATAVYRARDLVSEPGNVLTPKAFADACSALAAEGLEVEILDQAALAALGMNALLAVAQGSAQPPYVAVMRWQGGGSEPPLALVGKGVCFDTGGISIKPAQGMEDMKWDMGGAAAVFGAMLALAGRKAKANVVGVLGLAENMPSGTAQRPGDVVKSMAGKTIEVINTDAEGRLLLADVLHYTRERFKPKAIVDLATLTGAVVVALGHEQAGLFSNDEALVKGLQAAAEQTGELLWRLPLGKAYEKHIKSEIADLKNLGRGREAGSSAGAVFLQQFVGDVPWAHLDIAGVAWTSRDLPLAAKGATGFGVRLLDRLVAQAFEADFGQHLTEVGFYHLTRRRLEQALPRLLEKAYGAGNRVLVRGSDQERLELLNRALWTYGKDSFLPHGTKSDGFAEQQPIYLTTGAENPNASTILVLVDGADAPDLASFARCLELFDGGDPDAVERARDRWRDVVAEGHGTVYWQETERGGWTKAAEKSAAGAGSAPQA